MSVTGVIQPLVQVKGLFNSDCGDNCSQTVLSFTADREACRSAWGKSGGATLRLQSLAGSGLPTPHLTRCSGGARRGSPP